MPNDFRDDVESVNRIPSVPTILEVVCSTTGMCFAAVARVTSGRWIACSVLDQMGFGLKSGSELKVETTICHEILNTRELVVIDHAAEDSAFCNHPAPAMYGFQSYISVPIVLADGSFFGTLCAIDPLPAQLNKPGVIGMFQLFAELIAKHLSSRRKLTATEFALELAHSAMEGNTDCVTVLDVDGRMLSMNRNGCRLMEVDNFSSIANHYWSSFWQDPENGIALAALESARAGNRTSFNGPGRTAKGKEKYWDVTVSPIIDSVGRPRRILSIARDMTARRLEEAQLRETAKLESLGVLAGGIAHDFNNLLTGILGNASLLEESANPVDSAIAGQIVEAAQRAANLTRQMLAYSGKGRFLVQRLNLSTAIVEILNLIRTVLDKKVEVVLALDESLPLIEADPGQMQQLIMNLIINASESMNGKEGKVAVSTCVVDVDPVFLAQTFRSVEPSLTVGPYVKFEVHDTGSGMSEEVLSKIFDPFFTTKFTGRGLGLAAVSGILRGHLGAVRVYSHPGQGTTFKVFLPVARELPPVPALAPPIRATPLLKGWGTILLADDEDTVRNVGKTSLQRFGFDILLAENGEKAVALFKENRETIRLIVLDLTMPVMGGEEALTLLREIDPQVPILLSSGYNQVEIIRRFTTQSISGFIQKPYTVTQLNEAVAIALPDSVPAHP